MAKFVATYRCLNCNGLQTETVELNVETAAEAMNLYIAAKYNGSFVREPAIRKLEPVKRCDCTELEVGLASVVSFTKQC